MSSKIRQSLPKIADESGFIGEAGINLIATIVGDMRHLWTLTTAHSDKGIDEFIDVYLELSIT